MKWQPESNLAAAWQRNGNQRINGINNNVANGQYQSMKIF